MIDMFTYVPIVFDSSYGLKEDIFTNKNNKTVKETLDHDRYKKIKSIFYPKYEDYENHKLGELLGFLKEQGDMFYRNFLNDYGDSKFCEFYFENKEYFNLKGLYIFKYRNEIKYIGRCKGTYDFDKRINHGYGNISPKNCFIDGQSTNCHVNALIANIVDKENLTLWLYPLNNDDEIVVLEKDFIRKNNSGSLWNLQMY